MDTNICKNIFNYNQFKPDTVPSTIDSINLQNELITRIIDECYLKMEMFWFCQVDEISINQMYSTYLSYMELVADQGNEKACFLLGRYYGSKTSQHKDDDLAKKWLQRAFEKGEYHSIFNLYVSEKDVKRRKFLLEQAANKNEARALCQLGKSYLYSQNEYQKNQQQGIKFLKIAEEIKFPEAFYIHGKYSYSTKDYQTALEYFIKAYEFNKKRFEDAKSFIGECYSRLQKYQESKQWLNNKCIKSNLARANNYHRLGRKEQEKSLLLETIFLNEDDLQNLRNVYHNFGIILKDEKNLIERFKCYEIAAKMGNKQSLAVCGLLYFIGEGVERDREKGRAMILKACSKGSQYGKKYKERLNL